MENNAPPRRRRTRYAEDGAQERVIPPVPQGPERVLRPAPQPEPEEELPAREPPILKKPREERIAAQQLSPAGPLPKPKKKHRLRYGALGGLLLAAALLALVWLIAPKSVHPRALRTIGTEDGTVDTVITVPVSDYEGLRISELMAVNRSTVPDYAGEYADWVEIWNSTDRDINLKNVGLSDDSLSIIFIFPDTVLPADGRVIVFCDGTNSSADGDYHAKFKLSSRGETVYLYDPDAFLIDSCHFPILAADEVWALQDDGTFAASEWYSPGYPNGEEGYRAYIASTMISGGALMINEVMADARSGITDEDGEFSDWIELYNSSDRAIDLSAYALSDKPNKPLKWRFPEGTVISPGEYYLVFCSGKDKVEAETGVPHTNFAVSAEHESLVLSDTHGRLVDSVIIDNLGVDCSYGRNAAGDFQVYSLATPGLPNTQAGADQMDYNMRRLNASGVWISEVMASNDSVQTTDTAGFCDWIEIYNSSSRSVDLSGYGLSDTIDRARRWQFPEGTNIGAGQYLTVYCDGRTDKTAPAELHTNFKILRAGGETVCLADPAGRVLDKIVLPLVPTNISYGRTIGYAGFFYYDTPTPMAANNAGFGGYAQAPAFNVAPGLYYTTVRTSFTVPEGTTVHYTTDGSIPTADSPVYNGEAIELNFSCVLRARAFSDKGLYPSTVTTGTYLINTYHTMNVVSLTIDPFELYNPQTGMLYAGDNVDKSGGIPFKNTVYREFGKIGREAYIEYYDHEDGTQILSQGCKVQLQGQYSLDMPQKTFKLRAKSLYGQKYFDAKLFDDREFTRYKSLVLRNSGNDCVWTRLLDGFQSRLLDAYGAGVIHQAWNPVIVYLNGQYWGHYNMRERVDRYFVAQHEGLDLSEADRMDIVEANSKTKYGTNAGYKAMLKKIKAGDPAKNPEDLQYILDNVDVDNYFEYIALEMFFGNSDPGNIRYYRLHREGSKWRWILYDMDYGLYMSTFDSAKSYIKSSGMGQKKIDNTILLKLLSVPEYKDKFLRKLGDIFQFLTTEKMLEVLEPLVARLEPEMSMHFMRWGPENDKAIIAELPTSGDGAYRYWEQRIDRLRNTVKKRPNLFWGYVRDAFSLSDKQMIEYFGERPIMPADAI